MKIHSLFKDYEVRFESDFSFIPALAEDIEKSLFVIDRKVFEIYRKHFDFIPASHLFLLDATEENKVVETALAICEKMTGLSAKRNARLISFGGGIVQDLTGFVANIMYRGIRWTFVPTTLLSACDSCIGGKSSLNYKHFKNLLGTFYPPDVLHIAPEFFQTLSEKDFKSGLGEVIKFNIISGQAGLESMEANLEKLLSRNTIALNQFVENSLSFKKRFIEEDEFDRGERIKLNFAHTFGHAIETVSHYDIPHGTAVAIGMIMANRVSVRRGILDSAFAKRSEAVLLPIIDIDFDFSAVSITDFLAAIRKDKKQTGKELTAILTNGTDLLIVKDVATEEIADAVSYFAALCSKHKK